MKNLCSVAGISKQAIWKGVFRKQHIESSCQESIEMMNSIRKDHKRMGVRRMHNMEEFSFPIGRDILEQIAFANGFRLKRVRNPTKTTWGQTHDVAKNLIEGLIINNINKVWQSDIFYLLVENSFYYGICIEDVYSRKLLALHLSNSQKAEQNVKALLSALKARQSTSVKGCIFHSDRGSQYISKVQKELLSINKMRISMCKLPQENAFVERINGILKHEYFFEMKLTKKNIQAQAKRVLHLYNNKRPHSAIKMMTPTAYEHWLSQIGDNEYPEMQIHNWNAALSTEYQVVNKEKSSKKESLPNT